jgi:hypothetical protein
MTEVKDKETGKTIARFNYDDEGTMKAQQMADSDFNLEVSDQPETPMGEEGMPEENAMERSEQYYMGGKVPGQSGFGDRPNPNAAMNPGMGGNVPLEDTTTVEWDPKISPYKHGGKVKKRK